MKYLILLAIIAITVFSVSGNKEFVRTYAWKDADSKSVASIKDIVLGGHEANGDKLYVCRCLLCEGGHKIPGKVNLKEGICRVPFDMKEHQHPTNYQVLTNPFHYEITWFPGHQGSTPEGAVPAGEEDKKFSGDLYFICHAEFNGATQVGKTHREHKVCYFSVNGDEYYKPDYEILVITKEAVDPKKIEEARKKAEEERKKREEEAKKKAEEEKKKKEEEERKKKEEDAKKKLKIVYYEIHIDQKKQETCQSEIKLDLLCLPELSKETEKAEYNWSKLANIGSLEVYESEKTKIGSSK